MDMVLTPDMALPGFSKTRSFEKTSQWRAFMPKNSLNEGSLYLQ